VDYVLFVGEVSFFFFARDFLDTQALSPGLFRLSKTTNRERISSLKMFRDFTSPFFVFVGTSFGFLHQPTAWGITGAKS